jgi:hypothetical protein
MRKRRARTTRNQIVWLVRGRKTRRGRVVRSLVTETRGDFDMPDMILLNTVLANTVNGPGMLSAGSVLHDTATQTAAQAASGVLIPASDGFAAMMVKVAAGLRFDGQDESFISRAVMGSAILSVYTALSIFTGTVKASRLVVAANQANLAQVPSTADGQAIQPGNIVLLGGQTTASQNGPYIASVSPTQLPNTVTLTRPDWWAKGASFPGAAFLVSEGGVYAGTIWKAVGSTGPIVVDTSALNIYPQTVTGKVTLVAGKATVSNLFITATAVIAVTDTTTAAPATPAAATPTAGAGSGALAVTGTGTDVIAYTITNW